MSSASKSPANGRVASSTATIEEITETLIDYRGKTPPKSPSGIPLVTAKAIKNGRIDVSRLEYISETTYESWMRRGLPKQADVLITTEAPLGELAMLRTNEKVALAQRVILLRGKPDVIDQHYFFAALRSPLVQGRLHARATGTTVSGIKQSELRKIQIPLPPLSHQYSIAAILTSYDELIENNLRRIEILEEMARAIYQEWFVNLRSPGAYALPRARPEQWDIQAFDAVVEIVRRTVNPSHYEEEEFDHFSFAAFDGDGLPEMVSGASLKAGKFLVEERSVLLAKLNPRIRRVWFAHPATDRRSIASSEFLVLRPRPPLSLAYIYLFVSSDDFHDRLLGLVGGTSTSHQRVKPQHLAALKVSVPPEEVISGFTPKVQPTLDLIEKLRHSNRNLQSTRDLLLPKLVSGEIDVSDLNIDTSWLAA